MKRSNDRRMGKTRQRDQERDENAISFLATEDMHWVKETTIDSPHVSNRITAERVQKSEEKGADRRPQKFLRIMGKSSVLGNNRTGGTGCVSQWNR